MRNKMNIGIACGGTGGHVFPGLATAAILKKRGHDIVLWMSGRPVERSTPAADAYRQVVVPGTGMAGGSLLRRCGAMLRAARALCLCLAGMRGARAPDVMLAMGGYASAAPALAAKIRGAALVLHEANAAAGRTSLMLARFADAVAVHFGDTASEFRRVRAVVTGMPVREELEAAAGERLPPWFDGCFTILVMGGSLGAKTLNATALDAICRLNARGEKIGVIHLCGAGNEADALDAYEKNRVPHRVFPFLADMSQAYLRADFAVARAGASSCAELLLFRVPALLVPYPYAARNHQEINARQMERMGAAGVILEKDLTAERLASHLSGKIGEKATTPKTAPQAMDPRGAAGRLADLVEETGKNKKS